MLIPKNALFCQSSQKLRYHRTVRSVKLIAPLQQAIRENFGREIPSDQFDRHSPNLSLRGRLPGSNTGSNCVESADSRYFRRDENPSRRGAKRSFSPVSSATLRLDPGGSGLSIQEPQLMPLLFTDPRYLNHLTGAHPECPERLERILTMLDETGLRDRFDQPTFNPADEKQIARVHDPDYIRELDRFAEQGGGRMDADTVVSPESYQIAKLACGAGIAAVDALLTKGQNRAACLVRPPGHHALADRAMGFCLFNNIAVAAAHAVEQHGLSRILIVDWDVHHGNGTQDLFYRNENVFFLSVHRHPFYPGTGHIDETGTGPGLGKTANLPIRFGTSRADYFFQFQTALEDIADQFRPELVLLSAGFDAHHLDPVGSLGLETEDYIKLTKLVVDVAQTHAGGRLSSFLEGGYNLDVLPDCVRVHLETLIGKV